MAGKSQVVGQTIGLKKSERNRLERLTRRRVKPDEAASWELLREMSQLSRDIERRVGVVLNRKGNVFRVSVGDQRHLPVPTQYPARTSRTRLSGFRLIQTQLDDSGLKRQDQTELSLRRFDLVLGADVDEKGLPFRVHVAHLNPDAKSKPSIIVDPPCRFQDLHLDFEAFVAELEEELRRNQKSSQTVTQPNRAILCSLIPPKDRHIEVEIEETYELARTAGMEIVDEFRQVRDKPDPKYLVGKGKIEQISLRAAQLGVDLLLFQQNLTPNQTRHLTDHTDLRALDRTQLILDIFAQRAKSHDGKLQVELAQLKYNLPRLREGQTQMSRLVGGIGGRGPGETKLEIHRRRARDRIRRLEKQLEKVSAKRAQKRQLRNRKQVPVVSIVGYTNAGKSTLLNTLTHAKALAEDKVFATLDPFSKRLRFPRDRELILTDTVGFIRDLPPDLVTAFRATLEEIGEADLVLHVVDISVENVDESIQVVNRILRELGVEKIPQILILNKADLVPESYAKRLEDLYQAFAVSAQKASTCRTLTQEIEKWFWKEAPHQKTPRHKLA